MSEPSKRGSNGGNARAAKLTKEQRSDIAKKAAAKRWGKSKKESEPQAPQTPVINETLPYTIPNALIYGGEPKTTLKSNHCPACAMGQSLEKVRERTFF